MLSYTPGYAHLENTQLYKQLNLAGSRNHGIPLPIFKKKHLTVTTKKNYSELFRPPFESEFFGKWNRENLVLRP